MKTGLLALTVGFATAVACDRPKPPPPAPSAAPTVASAPAAAKTKALVREGNPLVRSPDEDVLYLADEDHSVVRRISLPVDVQHPPLDYPVFGAPANAVALSGRLLVTIRGKVVDKTLEGSGHLLVLTPKQPEGFTQSAAVELPADAWGIAVTPNEKTAIVTSAWTHQVSAVDLDTYKKLWTLDVGREPRGVIVMPDGKTAYVTHLVTGVLTRIDSIISDPKVREVHVPTARTRRVPAENADDATLGYSPVLSTDGSRLFLARQALGAVGKRAWNGQATVDVMLTSDESPLAVPGGRPSLVESADSVRADFTGFRPKDHNLPIDATITGPGPIQAAIPFSSPRAAIMRGSTKTLLIASEGTDSLMELDALAIEPSIHPLRRYDLSGPRPTEPEELVTEGAFLRQAHRELGYSQCGAPSGIALSADDSMAWVFCRSTDSLAIVALDAYDPKTPYPASPIPVVTLGKDPLDEKAALGRKLFYNASDTLISGGYACNACHPEGRDDGHVWHEDETPGSGNDKRMTSTSLHSVMMNVSDFEKMVPTRGAPRQTPMLAGRVDAKGPYGWKGRSPDIRHRIVSGFSIHRWGPDGYAGFGEPAIERAEPIAEFVRKGLVKPPRITRERTAEEEQGRRVFDDPNVGCAACHDPALEYTNRANAGLGDTPVDKRQFDEEAENTLFKTPSLFYVGSTPPYFHDGRAKTLEQLIEENNDRMGHTKQLSKADRAALIAFLRTL